MTVVFQLWVKLSANAVWTHMQSVGQSSLPAITEQARTEAKEVRVINQGGRVGGEVAVVSVEMEKPSFDLEPVGRHSLPGSGVLYLDARGVEA